MTVFLSFLLNYEEQLKGEEEIKASLTCLTGILKSIPDQSRKQAEVLTDQHKLHAISSAISSIPARIEARLQRLQSDICGTLTKELEVLHLSIFTVTLEILTFWSTCHHRADALSLLRQERTR